MILTEELTGLDKPCPYCNKTQKLTLANKGTTYRMNHSHLSFCPLANTVFKKYSSTVEGANKLIAEWEGLISEGIQQDKIISLLQRMEQLASQNSTIETLTQKLDKYESRKGYDEMAKENDTLRASVNSLSSERSKWLRKLKRAGVKV